jgi:hypothetical protein
MTIFLRLGAAALCAGAIALGACTEEPIHGGPQGLYDSLHAKFKNADSNADEQLTREEMQAGLPQFFANFDEMDTDHNGRVNFAELWSYAQWRYMRQHPEPFRQQERERY